MTTINKLLELMHDQEYREIPMQFLLVKFGGRKAYLFETVSFQPETVKKVLSLAREIGLRVSKDRLSVKDSPRYLIYQGKINRLPRTHEELGALLGFKDPGGNFFDSRHSRISLSIDEIGGLGGTVELTTSDRKEVEAFAEKKVRSFDQVMIDLGLPYRFEYSIQEIDGSLKRASELEKLNMKYIRMNKRKYLDDLWNELNGDEEHPFILLFNRATRSKKMMTKYLSFYSSFYCMINNGEPMDRQKIVDEFVKLIF